jgi:pSer/pThr/pTyr-binding forkhead associated (FHA) protein
VTIPVLSGVSPSVVSLLLPSGQRASIPRGQEITIGRQSEIPEVRAGLEPFDVVGRRHCYITVGLGRDKAIVRDPGSTNGTWVGDNPRQVSEQEQRSVELPTRIRLGQHLSITITTGGAL